MGKKLGVALVSLVVVACSSSPPSQNDAGACPGAKLNVDDSNCGACGNTCTTGTHCGGGQCLPANCSGAACQSFQVCSADKCAERACLGVVCSSGLTCAGGTCVPHDCAGQTCAGDQVCSNNTCVFGACVGVLCPSGQTCDRGICASGTCADGMRNGSETGVDCGGGCPGCPIGNPCNVAGDCLSQACVANQCTAGPACNDGVQNGAETDTDCGGGSCPGCGDTRHCVAGTDCTSTACVNGTCSGGSGGGAGGGGGTGGGSSGTGGAGTGGAGTGGAGTGGAGTGGAGTGGGTGTGGSGGTGGGAMSCSPNCPFDAGCLMGADCASGICVGMMCQPAKCSDTVQNGKETDVDCGGTGCPVCANDAGCLVDSDCLSMVCFPATLHCSYPTCTDGRRNGAELGVDCGGACPSSCGMSAAVSYPTGTNPTCVGAGDFDGDQKIDLVVASYTDKTVSFMKGNGDGTFQSGVPYSSGESCNAMVVADLGRDRKLDVIMGTAVNASGQGLHVLVGNGNGTLQGPTPYTLQMGNAGASIDIGDFNADGVPDVVANGVNIPAVWFGHDGGGGLTHVADLNYTGSAVTAALDFDGDGILDVVASNPTGAGLYGNFSLNRGTRDGGFTASSMLSSITAPYGSDFRALAHADLDGDNDDDLVFADATMPGLLWVVLNNSNGTSQNGTQYPSGLTGASRVPTHVLMTDFDNDGKKDVAVANSGTGNIGMLLGGGNGTLQTPLSFPARAGCRWLAVGDFNGDGKPDLACANSGNNTVSVLLNTFP